MFTVRDEAAPKSASQVVQAEEASAGDVQVQLRRRHGVLMDYLADEKEGQAEERFQMAVDEDFNDHLQWTSEDAQLLIERGQAPLVYNEGRLTVEWLKGTEKRTRIDYKILPRSEDDETGAEVKTKVFKYVDDVNLGAFHRSAAFASMVTAGVGYLEEGINIEPGEEIIYAGSAPWRDVYRDRRSRNIDYNKDGRYLFRMRRLDLDYAVALLPKCRDQLERAADSTRAVEDEVWYLGERLTSAHDLDYSANLPTSQRERRAFIGSAYADSGRKSSVELIEAWYKVPESVKFFQDGPHKGKVFDENSPQHAQAAQDGWRLYESVAWRMRVMICTLDDPLWDGPSPFKHQKFPIIPVFCYRRARDGMAYGVWRGMRDPQYDLNKRMSKALWAASSNRVVADDDAVEDVDEAREEIARPDAWIKKKRGAELRIENNGPDLQASLELANQDRTMIRTVGGVTSENLGHDTNAISGKAVLAKQDQGSMTTAEIFDNFRLGYQLAGRLRLSHIEQYKTEREVIRIVGQNRPIEWVTINDFDPETGQWKNDITEREADFIVSEQDYRASLQQAAAETMGEIFSKVAPYAPQAIVNVLDLWVDLMDVPNKEEFVSRIRKLNGQRDPSKRPTPEEMQAQQQAEAKAAAADQLQQDTQRKAFEELIAKIEKLAAETADIRTTTLYQSLQAAQIVATTPGVAPVADTIAKGAGFQDQGGDDPNIVQPSQAIPMAPPHQLMQADGAARGIETPAADGTHPVHPPVAV